MGLLNKITNNCFTLQHKDDVAVPFHFTSDSPTLELHRPYNWFSPLWKCNPLVKHSVAIGCSCKAWDYVQSLHFWMFTASVFHLIIPVISTCTVSATIWIRYSYVKPTKTTWFQERKDCMVEYMDAPNRFFLSWYQFWYLKVFANKDPWSNTKLSFSQI